MAKEIIIHAGLHKTASSSIQLTSFESADFLEKNGIVYPKIYLTRHNGTQYRYGGNHSFYLYMLFANNPDAPHFITRMTTQESIDQGVKEFKSLLENSERILISSESLMTMPRSGLQEMKAMLEEKGYRIRTVAFVRSPLSRLASLRQSEVARRWGLSREVNVHRHVSRDMANLQAVFDNVEFYSFKETCKHPQGPVGFLYQLLGIDDISDVEIIRRNDGLSANVIRLWDHVNSFHPLYNANSPRSNIGKLRFIKGEKFYFTQAEIDVFKEEMVKENAWLEENFGPEFCDKEIKGIDVLPVWGKDQVDELEEALPSVDQDLLPYIYDYFLQYDNVPDDEQKRRIDSLFADVDLSVLTADKT